MLLFDDTEGLSADAVVLAVGSMRERTEDRTPPPRLAEGEMLSLAGGATARVVACGESQPRRVRIRLEGEKREILRALYGFAKPIQYAYVERPLALYHVVLPCAGRPWASEMPSAGRPLDFAALSRIRAAGVQVVAITHGAGISSTGDAALDRELPFPERYEIGARAGSSRRWPRATTPATCCTSSATPCWSSRRPEPAQAKRPEGVTVRPGCATLPA